MNAASLATLLAEARWVVTRLASADGPAGAGGSASGPLAAGDGPARAAATVSGVPGEPPRDAAVDAVAAAFGLSGFERAVLVACAGVEVDGGLAARLADGTGQPWVTFGLALARLPGAHWSAVTPVAPLRRWRLVEPDAGASPVGARLRIDERVLHLLAGVAYLDPRVAAVTAVVDAPDHLPDDHDAIATMVGDRLLAGTSPRVHLAGDAGTTAAAAVAATACARTGRVALRLRAADLPTSPPDRVALRALVEREAVLAGAVLLVDADADGAASIEPFLADLVAPCVLLGERAARLAPSVHVELPAVAAASRRRAWRSVLGPGWSASLNGSLDALASQFDLDAAALAGARDDAELAPAGTAADRLWDAARRRARPAVDDLAQPIASAATWDDLVLPDDALESLRQLTAQVRRRSRVYDDWGFAARGSRGLGISALFAGPSGTGKTMAAEVIANDLRLDLFRIDLSAVVSKYIGETEKHLRRVFDAADRSSAVLLFDEADALFGRRTDVKDSHDRYANIEVSYLLQRMEAYRGLAILTTNRRDAVDEAFLRRIRFVVEFPFPDAAQRAEIWRRAFPADVPLEPLDVASLAALTVAGGNIRNIALGAAFLAADETVPVSMRHLRRAARTEYAKLERPLTSAELLG